MQFVSKHILFTKVSHLLKTPLAYNHAAELLSMVSYTENIK